jgi:hypothetical protein
MDWKQKENRAHAKGRRGPSCAKQRHVNETRTNPTTDNPPDPLNQAPPLPHRPRTTSKPLSPPIVEARQTYLHCLFQFHSIWRLCLLQRTFLAPQVLSKPWSMAIALFDHPLPRHLGVNDEPIPIPVLDIGFVPLFMVEHFIIAFNPYGPKCNSSKKMPN